MNERPDKYQAEVEEFSKLTPAEIGQKWSGGACETALFGTINRDQSGCLTEVKFGRFGNPCTTGDEKLDAIIRADERIPNPMANATWTINSYKADEGTIRIEPESLPVFAEINRMIDEKFPHVRS